jgi:hypothetical protein
VLTHPRRRIGPIGTASRVIVGLGLLFIAGGASVSSWEVEWFDLLVGFVALPAITIAFGLIARRYATGSVHFTGPLGIVLNVVVIVALLANEYTGGGATLFYGATMLIAAWMGQPGCESTVISNVFLRRDDQVGCPVHGPVDEVEGRLRGRKLDGGTRAREA